MNTESANKPVHTIRIGRVQLAIWATEAKGKTYYNTTLTRSYKVGEEFKHTTSFGAKDLPVIAKLASEAGEWVKAKLATTTEAVAA